jgi:AcrR family transcriptional regulator
LSKSLARRGKARTQAERSAATISTLVDAARGLFARQGYAETSIEQVLAAAGVTRGALYHHFDSKAALFQAVFEAQEAELTRAVAEGAGSAEGWAAFRAGCEAFLEACLDPATQRIVLIDAPAVLSRALIRDVEARFTLALLREGLRRAMDEGRLRVRPVEALAQLLLGALSEAAMSIARANDPARAAEAYRRELDGLLDALT